MVPPCYFFFLFSSVPISIKSFLSSWWERCFDSPMVKASFEFQTEKERERKKMRAIGFSCFSASENREQTQHGEPEP